MSDRANIRERRDGWARNITVKLTKRDIEILHALGTCGVLRTRDLVRLFFGSRATANDRLRKLYCAGLVDVHVRGLESDNYYTLTERGRDAVLDHRDGTP